MNILESQVTDLHQLAESPLAMNGQASSTSANSPSEPASQGGKKRRATEDEPLGSMGSASGGIASAHTRAKRNRYISIACNECKRRKIKCNGNTPCQRCGNLSLDCQYAPNCCTNGFRDSDEFRQMNAHLAGLQEQVDNLYASLNALRSNAENATTFSSERSMSVSQPPRFSPMRYNPTSAYHPFRGPTSSAFSLDVAKNTLHSMGYQSLSDEGPATHDPTPIASPPRPSPNQCRVDPVWALSVDECIRLCRVYEEEMGIMYPVVEIDVVIQHCKNLFLFVDAATRTGLAPGDCGKGITDQGTLVLKMVLACAMTLEGNGKSEVGSRLFESVREPADRILHGEAIKVESLPLLVLVTMYHFHCDEEALAWRIIGQVARMSIELGLHRRESLFKVATNEDERSRAIKLFWSIYVLDRRWSFGTGMPFAIQDADIDPSLPEPDLPLPYLKIMIAYSRFGSKVWRSITSTSPFHPTTPLNTEEIGFLDYQILQWQKSIPPELQLPTTTSQPAPSRAIHRLQILLYLRTNQVRIALYRPVLHSASTIQEHLPHASTVVDIAKDTIRALTHLNQTTDIYRVQQVVFNHFLISALAVIFLASCHAPVHFSSLCRDEFYMALNLVKGFSAKSFVSKRLWKTIKGLKEVGPRLGLNPVVVDDPHSSAALAMAGLAGHEISGMELVGEGTVSSSASGESPMNGFQMSNEMTNLFEAALGNVGVNGNGGGNANGYASLGAVTEGGDGLVGVVGGGTGGVGNEVFGRDEELYRHLRDLF